MDTQMRICGFGSSTRPSWAKSGPIRVLTAVLLMEACSCAPEHALQGVVGRDVEPPGFESLRAIGPSRLELVFTERVTIGTLRFDPPLETTLIEDDSDSVFVEFASALKEGDQYVVDLVAADPEGNTINVFAPFRGRNDRMPKMVINELRTEYSKPKVEFLELRMLSDGQLNGVRVVASGKGFGEPVFTFPSVEVKAGDFLVLHLRTLEEACIDELAALEESGGTEASPLARDFWVPGTEKAIRKTDAIAVLDSDGLPLDAVILSETPEGDWKSDAMKIAVAYLAERAAWQGKNGTSGVLMPADAVVSVGTTTTRTLCRDAASFDGASASDWKVVATGCATPGQVNREDPYLAR